MTGTKLENQIKGVFHTADAADRDLLGTEQYEELFASTAITVATDEQCIAVARGDLLVDKVQVVGDAAVTGANTNNFTCTVTRYNSDGTGATVVATLEFALNVNLVKFSPKALTNQALANLRVSKGQVLTYKTVQNGSGLAQPDIRVVVTVKYGRDD